MLREELEQVRAIAKEVAERIVRSAIENLKTKTVSVKAEVKTEKTDEAKLNKK